MNALEQIVPDGYKQTDVGVIPNDWESINFGELFEQSISRKPIKASDPVTFIGMQDVSESAQLTTPQQRVFEQIKTGFTYFEKNDVLVAKITPCFENGKGCYTDKITTRFGFGSTEFHVLRAKENSDAKFIYFWTTRNSLRQDLEGEMVGSAGHRRVPFSAIQNYLIPCPSSRIEQTAIANALSDVDALLTELENLIAKKQAIKTATMQQLLTGKTRLPQFATYTEGEKQGVPQGKCKGTKPSELGEIPEDWDVSTIADISLVPMQNGLFYEPARKGKGVPLINVSDMYTSAPISVESLELFNASKTELKAFKVNEGDLFFTRSSIVPNGIAFCNVLPKSDKEVVFDSHLIRVRVNPKIADYNYVYLNCLAKHSRLHLIANSKTATMTTIDQKAINCCPVLLPCKEEQTAIATILSDMDNEIQTLEQRLAKTRQIKQGMMQQLLTGRTRLPFKQAKEA
ncbi:restriction endonuclease subunit S [Pseudoalteromonas sp. C8]|uniref:restriction endonuclease subunit S n=1 Tax=Pseudoalteromonas sp. C8 TaxID=2686345 RepID=UPI0013FDB093|nr:restriction endonuclease subunit S [Pseudoalteromonas sp. C8]